MKLNVSVYQKSWWMIASAVEKDACCFIEGLEPCLQVHMKCFV